ncbi:MAG: hypothetical protein ABIR08_06545 [Sphingomonas sp.]
MRNWTARIATLPVIALAVTAMPAMSRQPDVAAKPTGEAARDAADLALFAHKVALAKDVGATQIVVTEGLPPALWELDRSDPYPGWFINHATLFKIFPPARIRPFVSEAYAQRVQRIVAQRCAVIARAGLKAVWAANEPAVLPEAFFAAYPEMRGPRIDHPERSRKAHFAPNVDNPDILAMYRESTRDALRICPQIETFSWVTTDAGSGFDWTPSLYSGVNGNSDNRDRPIADRVVGFMTNIQGAARDAGHEIRINISQIEPRQWMIPTWSPDVLENIIRKLPRGLAVEGREGPDGRRFDTGGRNYYGGGFYPIVGLAVPTFAPVAAPTDANARVTVTLGDPQSIELNYRLLKFTRSLPMRTATERLVALRAFAASEAGEAQADNLIEAWSALNDTKRYLEVLDFGGMLRFGHVLNRWITRPMVPFPLELTDAERADYRPFLFQAKGEEEAANLVDIQAMRMYEGWGAKLLFQRSVELATPRAERALALIQGIAATARDDAARRQWSLMARRVQALIYLLRSADDMVGYQAQLDRVTTLGIKPESNPELGVQSGWDRTEMLTLARREIDTMVSLKHLLEESGEPILDLALNRDEETIMRLGPDVPSQLKHKIDIMNAHWRDYDRLFTKPNP